MDEERTELSGKVAVVTGASSGIGMAVARDLRAAGMRVVVTGRRAERLDGLVRELGEKESVAVAGDVLDAALPGRLIEAAVAKFGRCDVCFNNAGVMHVGTIEGIDLEAVCAMVRINVESAYRMAFVALRHFLKQKSGHLVNTSSTLGLKVRPTAGAYAGTKFAIEALSEDLRMQVAGTGVRVSVVEPGLTETGLQSHFAQHPAEALGITRMAKPEDLARAVRFILEQPPHVTIPRLMVQPSQQAM